MTDGLPQLLGQMRRESAQQQDKWLGQLRRARNRAAAGQFVVQFNQLGNRCIEPQTFDVFADLFDRAMKLPIPAAFGNRAIASSRNFGGELSSSPAKFRQTELRNRVMPMMSRVFQGFWASSWPIYISYRRKTSALRTPSRCRRD